MEWDQDQVGNKRIAFIVNLLSKHLLILSNEGKMGQWKAWLMEHFERK